MRERIYLAKPEKLHADTKYIAVVYLHTAIETCFERITMRYVYVCTLHCNNVLCVQANVWFMHDTWAAHNRLNRRNPRVVGFKPCIDYT